MSKFEPIRKWQGVDFYSQGYLEAQIIIAKQDERVRCKRLLLDEIETYQGRTHLPITEFKHIVERVLKC